MCAGRVLPKVYYLLMATEAGLELDRAAEELTRAFDTQNDLSESLQYVSSGAVKDVVRLRHYPGLAMAIGKSPRQNSMVDKEHSIMMELAKRPMKVLRLGAQCFDSPCKTALFEAGTPLVKDCRAFLMQFVEGMHVFPNHGIDDAKPERIPAKSALYRRAEKLGILACPSRLGTLIEDLAALQEYGREWTGCFIDLQGMMETHTGHFYLCDPSYRALESSLKQEANQRRLAALIETLRATHAQLCNPQLAVEPPADAAPAAQPAGAAT